MAGMSEFAVRTWEAFRNSFMPERTEWNRLGPRVPQWFRDKLRDIDRQLVLQFIPPMTVVGHEGCSPQQFPYGVWVICRRMRRTRFLYKEWVHSLSDDAGRFVRPGPSMVRIIRMVKNMSRDKHRGRLMSWCDEQIHAIRCAKEDAAQSYMAEELASVMSSHSFSNTASPRVSVPCAIA